MKRSMLSVNLPIAVLIALCGFAAAQSDSAGAPRPVAGNRKVLIARDTSYLEKTVTRMLRDSLVSLRCTVSVADIRSVGEKNLNKYAAIVFMNAVRASNLNRDLRQYISGARQEERDRILIATVYGQAWDSTNTGVNAITGATKDLKPLEITARLMERIRAIIRF